MEQFETIAVAINGSQEKKMLSKFEAAETCEGKEEMKNVQKSPEDNSSFKQSQVHLDMM